MSGVSLLNLHFGSHKSKESVVFEADIILFGFWHSQPN